MGGDRVTFTTPTSRPEPDELDERVRSLDAERARPGPQPVPKRLWTPPLPTEAADNNDLLQQVIQTLATGLYDPHDWRPLE
jgi:hypothetical protein